jgi:hypothetical protein
MDEERRQSFSRRYGYLPYEKEITIREDAPEAFRAISWIVPKEPGSRPYNSAMPSAVS